MSRKGLKIITELQPKEREPKMELITYASFEKRCVVRVLFPVQLMKEHIEKQR